MLESFRSMMDVWKAKVNTKQVKINWRFTVKDARITLKRLYPVIEEEAPDGKPLAEQESSAIQGTE